MILKNLNDSYLATSDSGKQITVKIVPLKRLQNSTQGMIWVEVGQLIELESGKKIELNLDGKSFYTGINELYRFN